MIRRDRTGERIVALFLLGALLLLPPVLLIANRPERVLGIPVLHLYIFAAWALLIAISAAIARRIETGAETSATLQAGEPARREEAPRA